MEPLKILHLEDSETDAEIVKRLLKKEQLHYNYRLCMTREEYIDALEEFMPDVILADNSLPQFDAAEALNIANHFMLKVPFILVTGTMSEEFAVDMIKRGADDYILKDRLGRLTSAIDTALRKRRAEKEKSIALEKLVQSEEKYRMLFERNLAGVYLTTVAGTIINCNDAFAAMLGYSSHAELEQVSAFSLYFDSKDRDQFINNLRNKKQVSNYESVLKHKDGHAVNVLENISLLTDAVTGEELIEGVMLDFTEHKQMQEALLYEQYLMQTLMNNLPDAIYFKDHESRFLRISKSQAAWLGLKDPLMALGKTDYDFFPKNHADSALSDEIEIMQTGQSITREEKEVWPGGSVTYAVSTKMPLRNQQGDITGTFGISRDITKRKKAEILIQESEEKYRTMMERVSDAFAALDKNGIYTYVNKSAAAIFNLSEEEMIGKNVWTLFPESVEMPFYNAFYEALRTQQYTFVENYYTASNIWLENHFYPSAEGISIFFRDVTKQKKADALIKESEEKYRTLVEQAFDGIIIYASDGTILDCNLSACTYTGYSSEELKSFNVTKLFFKDELEARPLKFELLYSGHPTLDHRRLKRKDGTSVDMEIATKIMPDGRLMAVGRDITERRKAQAQQALFASIVNSSDDAIISKNLDGVITSWNRGAEALFGYTEKEMVGNNISALVPADLSGEETAILKKISQGDYVQHYETVRVKKDGSRVFVSLTVSPVRNSKGLVIGASKIARDISERKAAEQKIIQSEINLKAIFDNTSEGFVLVDRDGTVKAFNGKTKESIFVNSEVEMKAGKNIFEFVDHDRKDFFKKVMINVLKGNTIQYDRAFNMGNGSFRWINFSLNPVVKDKKIDGFCITGRDITDKKIAEQEKEFTHNNLDALINNTHDLIWSIDKDFNLITSNLAFKKTVKLLSGITVLKGSSILIDAFGPFELTRYKEFYQRALAGETFTEVLFSNTPIGLWSEVSFYPIYEGSSVIGTACFSRNITDRKKAEEELKRSYAEKQVLARRMSTIINTLPANIALLDEKGVIVDVNEAWKSFADKNGFQSPHYAVGDNYIEIADTSFGEDEGDGKKVATGIRKVLNKKIKAFEYEYPCHSPEEKRWFRMVVTPIAGREQGAVVMHVDISELRKLEAERMESKIEEQKNITQAMILGQEKERNAIGRELHDNMNQILAGVNLLLGMLRTKPERLDQYLPLCIEHINLAIKENRKIAHELVSPNQVSESLINQIDRLCTNMLQNAGLETTIDHEKFDEHLVHADQKLAIYRVVQEQCTNIVKYAQARQVEFKLSTSGNLLMLQIKDDGQGMKTGKKTDGIGLQNMMSRVSVLNGKLKINTKPGKGFALHVEIPLA